MKVSKDDPFDERQREQMSKLLTDNILKRYKRKG